MTDWYLTVDGGGTGMRLGVYVGDSMTPRTKLELDVPGSLTLGVERSVDGITQGIERLRSTYEGMEQPPRHIQCGLAGSLEPSRLGRFLQQWHGQAIDVVTDGYGQLIGATQGRPGACMSVGTGSVVHWLDESGYSGMAGGWGFPVGDLGGGAQLGLCWLQLELMTFDQQGPSDLLVQLIGEHKADIQAWCAHATATEFAALCPAIIAATDNASAVAAVTRAQAALDELVAVVPAHLPRFVAGALGVVLCQYQPGFRVSDGSALEGLRRIQLGSAPKEVMR
ncbi:hypothetical protein [Litorivicinus lipolyticus]|uniref:hypothetical protein n=1 Tax=Litorivicinus lipolyticus TaxID=418701 RepID=UPI003B5C5C40